MTTENECHTTLAESARKLELPFTEGIEFPNGLSLGHARIPEGQYCIIRVDGRAFHTFTRAFRSKEVPFSPIICGAMKAALEALIDEFQPIVAYSQSDEITLVIEPRKVMFSRKVSKLNSIAASVATAYFNAHIRDNHGKVSHKPAVFDARSYGVPMVEHAALVLLWRQIDGIRNSISHLARAVYSQAQLDGKTGDEKINMMADKDLFWDDLRYDLKYGLIAYRGVREINLNDDPEYLAGLPKKAIENIRKSGGIVTRSYIEYVDNLPPFREIQNLPEVLFERAVPVLKRNIFEDNA